MLALEIMLKSQTSAIKKDCGRLVYFNTTNKPLKRCDWNLILTSCLVSDRVQLIALTAAQINSTNQDNHP